MYDEIESKYDVTIFEPGNEAAGITVLLGGATIALSEYESTKDVLLAQKQIVIGFNRLVPKIPLTGVGKSHDEMAENVSDVVSEVRTVSSELHKDIPKKYSIVGHSMGGKVSLLVAAKFDQKQVSRVIALDPVDDHPQEITTGKVKMTDATAALHLTRAQLGGNGSPEGKSATAIRSRYPSAMASYTIHEGAGHMAYTDDGGGPAGWILFPKGDTESNLAAREGAHELIRKLIN